MKLRKQEDSGLRKIQPGLEKANLHARIMSEVIREGNGGITSREEGEEDTRKQLAPWERRAWDKISQGGRDISSGMERGQAVRQEARKPCQELMPGYGKVKLPAARL